MSTGDSSEGAASSLATASAASCEVAERQRETPAVTLEIEPSAVEVGGYIVRGTFVPTESGNLSLKTSLHPKPHNAKEAFRAVEALCKRIFELNLEVKRRDIMIVRLSAENNQLKDEKTKLLQEKAELNQAVSLLNNQLEDLRRTYTDLNERFESINARNEQFAKKLQGELDETKTKYEGVTQKLDTTVKELKETKTKYEGVSETLATTVRELKDTRETVEKLQRMQVFAGIGSWIEFARSQILKEMKIKDVTSLNQAEKWRELCKEVKHNQSCKNLFNTTVKQLFELEPFEWILVSVEFYKNNRNAVVHERPKLVDALKLLDKLPPPFDSRKRIFENVITHAATMEVEDDEDL